jgi:hypothetical protein
MGVALSLTRRARVRHAPLTTVAGLGYCERPLEEFTLDKPLRAIVAAIARATIHEPPSVVMLAERLNKTRDALIAPLADLEAAGVVLTWIDRKGLTRVALLQDPRERQEAKAARFRRQESDVDGGLGVAGLPDPKAPDPAELAEARERIERFAAVGEKGKGAKNDPKPRRPTAIMTGCQSWPPRVFEGATWKCQVCRDAPMHPADVCLWCGRWGMKPSEADEAPRMSRDELRARAKKLLAG